MPVRRLAPILFLAVLAACGGKKADAGPSQPVDILAALQGAPGVVSVEERTPASGPGSAGYRLFWIGFEQPVDHAAPSGARFRQFASLLWKDEHRPMVFATNGYFANRAPGRSELTALLEANQLTVEHRFFLPSAPAPDGLGQLPWQRLTIQQAAADHHAVVSSLRPRLGVGKWISVGASKGGMTAVYHRRFHPGDVDGTLAYVAPQSLSTSDTAYVGFVQSVGGAAYSDCRDALETFQRTLLARRGEVQPLFEDAAIAEGDGFEFFGPDLSYEISVIEVPFAFWQYGTPGTPAGCAAAFPDPDAAPQLLMAALDFHLGGVTSWLGDVALEAYAPYYYQSATQLGGPAYGQDHLLDLLPGGVPVNDVPEVYPPGAAPKSWDATAMPDVGAWVSSAGERLMFVYGEYDPWSTRPFEPSAARDSFRYVKPGGNHGSNVTTLPAADRAEATATLRRWAGLPAGALTAEVPLDFDPWALLSGERGAPRDANSPNRPARRAGRLDAPPTTR